MSDAEFYWHILMGDLDVMECRLDRYAWERARCNSIIWYMRAAYCQ